MRIVAGAWKGRTLSAPPGLDTRPTADRVRQALFDILLHAPWAGRSFLENSPVLDLFAGTGALGLEALSRGAAHATFVEQSRPALVSLRKNIVACGAEDWCTVLAIDALAIPAGPRFDLVFLDPPYGRGLVARAMVRLRATARVGAGSLIVAETGRDEPVLADVQALSDRSHGPARITIWRE